MEEIRNTVRCFPNRPMGCFGTSPHSTNRTKTIVLLIVLLVLLSHSTKKSFSQDTSQFFGVETIVRDVKTRFKLSRSEVRDLIPSIKEENQNVILIYNHYSPDEPGSLPALWRDVIDFRIDFEARVRPAFTKRQKAALRQARTELERRILNLAFQDCVGFLGEFLDLGRLEFEGVERVLSFDFKRKHQAILKHLSNTSLLETEIKKVNDDTEQMLGRILSSRQMRLFRALSASGDSVASLLAEQRSISFPARSV
jgi:hypothetical protein